MGFSNKTFQYFDQAKKNKNNLKWFEKNRILYQESVRKPFAHLVELMQKELQRDLPRIEISPRSITRPLRPKNRAERGGGLVKDFSHLSLAEKRSSLFEWNPGIYIQLGADQDHSLVGLGLYMVSSRQLSLLRNAVTEDFEEIDALSDIITPTHTVLRLSTWMRSP